MTTIDVHTHGFGGFDTRTTDPGHILAMARLQASQGVSAILPTIYAGTVRVMRENMAVVRKAMEKQQASRAGHPAQRDDVSRSQGPDAREETRDREHATILGVHLEGPFLNPSRCGALNAMTFLEPSEARLQELLEGFEDMVRIITLAPELPGAVQLIDRIAGRGIVASLGHSDASYEEGAAAWRAGARGITHLFNAMSDFHHREPGLAGFGILNDDIFVEVIADPYHLHEATLNMIFRLKRHDRILLVSDSVRETKATAEPEGIADDHGTLLGGSVAVTEAAEGLIREGVDPAAVRLSISAYPARYLGL
jgi:N-acetylglucosamine-6-phosphate deacetylase